MGRLTKRGWGGKGTLITSGEAQSFMDRCFGQHTQQWMVNVVRYAENNTIETLASGVPITGGSLTLDSSDVIRRKLTLNIGGGDEWAPKTADSPLVPFGQVVHLHVRIDMADGTWSPWLKMGEFLILSNTFERPSEVTTLECADYSAFVDEYLHLKRHVYKDMTLRTAIIQMVTAALPDKEFGLEIAPNADDQARKVAHFKVEAGDSRWDAATTLAGKKGFEAFFDWNGDLVLRHDVTDDDDDEWDPASVGPDIGDVNHPIAVVQDGNKGSLVGMTATTTREGGANAVSINVTGQVTRRAKKQNKKKKGIEKEQVSVTRNVKAEVTDDDSPVKWGDVFGYLPLVLSVNVAKITDDIMSDQQTKANKLLHRRKGLIRYIDFDSLPLLWLEPDDKVQLTWTDGYHGDGTPKRRTEDHYVQSIEFDLGGGAMRCRTRQLAVRDPGA